MYGHTPKCVLVTGSTGAVGAPLCRFLRARGHTVRGFARHPSPAADDCVIGDLADADKVREAVNGVDTVVHLGAYPNPAGFVDVLLQPNVVGLFNTCEAAREYGVRRLVLASTMQVMNGYGWRERLLHVEDETRPDNFYGLTKVWSETMGAMYARRHNLSVISVRIGWLPRNPEEARHLGDTAIGPDCYLSEGDSNRFHALCIESPKPKAGESCVLYATSRPVHVMRMDLEPARRMIGYEPQDAWPHGLSFEH